MRSSGLAILLGASLILGIRSTTPWGFYGHKLINRTAVFTLPSELMWLYKPNMEFIAAHAVDPDKRRYISIHEANRHYIDFEFYNDHTSELARSWAEALVKYSKFVCHDHRDTIVLAGDEIVEEQVRQFARQFLVPQYYSNPQLMSGKDLSLLIPDNDHRSCEVIEVDKSFAENGILPYHLIAMQRRLTSAFKAKSTAEVLRLSADIGHYIADAHVPLHTTRNYNGQLTGQTGIHAFWESRIPELFATEYDFLVGRADYIKDVQQFYWKIVEHSHSLTHKTLETERDLTASTAGSSQYCYDKRKAYTVLTECEKFARQYSDALDGMVEEQMQSAVHAIGSAWYTAWVDAGKPVWDTENFSFEESELDHLRKIEKLASGAVQKGREHVD